MTIAAGETILASDLQAIKDDVDAIVSASQAIVLAGESTTSASFTNLTTSGPSVTLTTGTLVLVSIYAAMENDTAGDRSFMSFEVSGASSASAHTNRSISIEAAAVGQGARLGAQFLVTVTAGSNTFTAKYQSPDGGTATFYDRRIVVIPLGA